LLEIRGAEVENWKRLPLGELVDNWPSDGKRRIVSVCELGGQFELPLGPLATVFGRPKVHTMSTFTMELRTATPKLSRKQVPLQLTGITLASFCCQFAAHCGALFAFRFRLLVARLFSLFDAS